MHIVIYNFPKSGTGDHFDFFSEKLLRSHLVKTAFKALDGYPVHHSLVALVPKKSRPSRPGCYVVLFFTLFSYNKSYPASLAKKLK